MKNISINKIHPFEGHPYKVLDNEEMNNLIQSVQKYGDVVLEAEEVWFRYEKDGVDVVRGLSLQVCGTEGRTYRGSCLYLCRKQR